MLHIPGWVARDYQGNELVLRDVAPTVDLVDPLTPPGAVPAGITAGALVFSDEFQVGALNTEKWIPFYPDTDFWNTTVPGGHLSNTDEPQGYDISGISFDSDGMVFTLREEETVPGLAYTSGMVCSFPSFNPVHGAFEARMRLSDTDGAWPAFWMMPTAQVRYPEIDIVENDGKAAFNLQTYHTLHTSGGMSSDNHDYAQDVGSQWHTFGCLWEPNRIRWYVDGEVVKDSSFATSAPMYLICNLAGQKESTPQVPASVHVDYIRAWEVI